MTWNSNYGERTLEGAEATLIGAALSDLVENCRNEIAGETDHWIYGVALFDCLEPGVQLALLAEVGHDLLCDTKTCPELTAVNEAAIAAMYRHIEQAIEVEIEFQIEDDSSPNLAADPPPCPTGDGAGMKSFWRSRVLAVFQEDGEVEKLPTPCSTPLADWSLLVELLHDRVLWDTDYEMGNLFLDTPPKKANALRELMNVHDDYFRAIPPDPNEDELEKILERLNQLCKV